jgi:uncharacterized protein
MPEKTPAAGLPGFMSMIKPAGAQCNMECAYCYYLHKKDGLGQPERPRMSERVLEEYIRQTIAAHTGPEVVFSWQGGEPTIMGTTFFERVVELQEKYKKPGQAVENDLQTNGVLLDEAWCAFLKERRFLVGISIDGPRELHDACRYSAGRKPTFDRVMHAVDLLRRFEIPFCSLSVVNRVNATRALEVYRFLRDEVRPRMIQFIPCVEPAGFEQAIHGDHAGGGKQAPSWPAVTGWSVLPEDWGWFLCRIWDEWMRRDFGRVFVDQFENVISMMFGHGAMKCVNGQYCGHAVMLEHNGDMYSCDHFGYADFLLGNILRTDAAELVNSERQRRFGLAKSSTLPAYCKACAYLRLCWGECPKNRFARAPTGEQGLNYLCPGMKLFYAKATGSCRKLESRLFR